MTLYLSLNTQNKCLSLRWGFLHDKIITHFHHFKRDHLLKLHSTIPPSSSLCFLAYCFCLILVNHLELCPVFCKDKLLDPISYLQQIWNGDMVYNYNLGELTNFYQVISFMDKQFQVKTLVSWKLRITMSTHRLLTDKENQRVDLNRYIIICFSNNIGDSLNLPLASPKVINLRCRLSIRSPNIIFEKQPFWIFLVKVTTS